MEGWIRMARFLLVLLFNLPPYSTVRAEACRRRLPSLSSYRQASAKLQEVRLFPRHSSITSRKMHRKVSQPSWAKIPSQKGQLLSFHLIPLNPPFSISLPFPALLVFLSYQVSSLIFPSSVVVRFKSIGSAPIMKNNVFKVTAGNRFQAVIVFLRTQLGLNHADPLVRLSKPDWDGS